MDAGRVAKMRERGVTLVEVVVVMALVLVVLLIVAMLMPAARESAREVRCRKNLGNIGKALLLYDNGRNRLPMVQTPLGQGESPLGALLGELGLLNFAELSQDSPRRGPPGPAPAPKVLDDVLCPSDPFAAEHGFAAPVSYRANTGSDARGSDGPFAIGVVTRLADVREADGTEYTAGFAERLVGTGQSVPDTANYARVGREVENDSLRCGSIDQDSWRGDAGSDWSIPGWVSTLYNYAERPNARPSCIAHGDASARMGASSGHSQAVHVLMLDGHIQTVRPSIDLWVWRAMATPGTSREQ